MLTFKNFSKDKILNHNRLETIRLFDPIHGFIAFEGMEVAILNSIAVQRLRLIHQLALAYMVYPGGCHSRYEHSVGVVCVASKIYDILIQHPNISCSSQFSLPETSDEIVYWRRVVRMAALCHDIGHLPFSHASEEVLLPKSCSHESLTMQLILSDAMKELWETFTPPLSPNHVAAIAVGPKFYRGEMTQFEKMLHQIIGGDVFGADRIDYILRDSYHTGLRYGNFDHEQLITHLKFVIDSKGDLKIALDFDGLAAAESLLLARYFLFQRLYWHPTQMIQTVHLNEYVEAHLNELLLGSKPNWQALTHDCILTIMGLTDIEVMGEMRKALLDQTHSRHILSKRVLGNEQFKLHAKFLPSKKSEIEGVEYYKKIAQKHGLENVRYTKQKMKDSMIHFPVIHGSELGPSSEFSELLHQIPRYRVEFVFINPNITKII